MNAQPDIQIIDSKDDPKAVYVVVDECKALVQKIKLKDVCYVLRVVNNVCYLNLDPKQLEECK
jgi:hypothetical protein